MSSVPSLFSRVIPLKVNPPKVEKLPPTRIAPLVCTWIEDTNPFAPKPGWKLLSIEPSGFNRARRTRLKPLKVVKSPPTRIFPSGWTANARTVALPPVPMLKVASTLPLVSMRASRA